MTTPALDALRALLPLLARDEDRAVTGVFNGDTLNAIEAALALVCDDDADDAGLRHESEKAQLRAEIDRLQSNLTASASAFAALEAVAAEARRNDAIAMSWIAEAKHAIGYEGDMPGFIEALRALKADPWPTIARGMITPAHIASPCKAPPPPNDLEASIRDTIARFVGGDDLTKDAADAVLEIVRPLTERSDRLEAAEEERDSLRADKATLQQMTYSLKDRLEAAEKERDALRSLVVMRFDHDHPPQFVQGYDTHDLLEPVTAEQCRWFVAEIERLSAEVAHIKEVEFPRKAQAVADGWRGKCERLEAKIEQMEIGKREISEAHNVAKRRLSALAGENIALQAKIVEMERQEPAYWGPKHAIEGGSTTVIVGKFPVNPTDAPLYALPGAKGEEK